MLYDNTLNHEAISEESENSAQLEGTLLVVINVPKKANRLQGSNERTNNILGIS